MRDGLARLGEVESEQVVVALELEPAQLRLRLGRARHEGEEPVAGTALRAPDEEDAALREPRPLLTEVLLQLARGGRSGRSRRAPQRPRYSIRIQVSTRLAVAASDSASASEVSAQSGLLAQEHAEHLAARDGVTRRDGQPATMPARWAEISFSIFIASTRQSTWPSSTRSPSATSTFSTVPCIGLTTAPLPAPSDPRRPARAAAGRALPRAAPARGASPRSVARRTSTGSTAGAAAGRRTALLATALRRELRRAGGERLRLDEAVAGLAGDEARLGEERAVEADQRRRPSIANSSSARSIRSRACSRSTPRTISFAIIGS